MSQQQALIRSIVDQLNDEINEIKKRSTPEKIVITKERLEDWKVAGKYDIPEDAEYEIERSDALPPCEKYERPRVCDFILVYRHIGRLRKLASRFSDYAMMTATT